MKSSPILPHIHAGTIGDKRRCGSCGGRGFDLDWIDQGGTMRAVPGETCTRCNGTGERPQRDATAPDVTAK